MRDIHIRFKGGESNASRLTVAGVGVRARDILAMSGHRSMSGRVVAP